MCFSVLNSVYRGARQRVLRPISLIPLFLPTTLSSAALGQETLPGITIGRSAPTADDEVVVTPDRIEEAQSRTGASITVIPAAQIERRGSLGLSDVLRGTPGLDVYETGGPGTQASVFLRGSDPGQTLVMIDGLRIGDPSSTDSSVDLGSIAATDIERIEVLRGPQSALYGSDAMGGVINIITRKGEGRPRGSVLLEGGHYGTGHTRANVSGSEDRLSYAISVDALHTEAFARYGYRIGRPLTIGDGVTPLPPLPPNDPTNRTGATARFSYSLTEGLSVEGGFTGYDSAIRFDNPYAFDSADVFNPANHQHATFAQGYMRADTELLDHMLHNRLTLFANVTNRDIWRTESCFDANFNAYTCRMGFRGKRRGLEYQGELRLGKYGVVIFGAKNETEAAHLSQDPIPASQNEEHDFVQTTHSGFAQHQFTLLDRFDFTYGGRVDAIDKNQTFETWRVTAAYRLEETGTKFRGSAGTGAKAASLYQRYSQYGNPGLKPERSEGYDIGVDQKFFGGLFSGSLSLFDNRYNNLIEFGSSSACTATQVFGCYFNVGRAEMKGVELSSEAILVPDELRLRVTYTYLSAKNRETERTLLRRPYAKGSASLIYTIISGFDLEARLTAVSQNPDYDYILGRRVTMAPYARVDLYANYKLDERLSFFGRLENISNTHYEEVYNFGTPGRSFYGGVKFTW